MKIGNRYRVVYVTEDGCHHTTHVWAESSVQACKKVREKMGVDDTLRVRRANGAVIFWSVVLGITAILILSACL